MNTATPRRLFITAVLAATGAVAMAQTPAPTAAPGQPAAGEQRSAPGQRGQRMDPAQRQQRMTERHAQRMAELKAQLKITAAQEGAWNTYAAAMQPPAGMKRGPRMDRAEFDKLTTPQRIDRMQALRSERMAQMNQRADATKAFYAQLTPEQQKTFDQRALRGGRDGHRGGPGRHGHEGGRGMGPGPR